MVNTKTVSGESPLVVFVSSVMNNELNEARIIVKNAIEESFFLNSWLFEYTPASSSSVEQTYLQKVREADFVIWLIGSCITEPVEKEILECFGTNRSNLLIFKLPTYKQDNKTEELLTTIGNYARWKKVESIESLVDEIKKSIGDEITKAVRKNHQNNGKSLEDLINSKILYAKENSISHWTSIGLSKDIAENFYNDSSVGVVKPEYLPNTDNQIKILIGEIGSGKTLIAERYYFRELNELQNNSKHPIPVFLKANSASPNLKYAIDIELTEFRDFKNNGITLIIDGLDEISPKYAKRLLEECKTISSVNNKNRVFITSREILNLFKKDEYAEISLLTKRDIGNIFDKIGGTNYQVRQFGTTMNFDRDWNSSIEEAIKRPLFAIMIAKYIVENHGYHSLSIVNIIQDLIRKILIDDGFDSQNENLLIDLAIKLIGKQQRRINENELNLSQIELFNFYRSHFLNIENKFITFKLSLFLEWFACQKLSKDELFLENIINENDNFENWRFTFSLFISTSSFEVASKLLVPLIKKNPAFAGSLISDCLDKLTLTEFFPYTNEQVYDQIMKTFNLWLSVLQTNLSQNIAPVDSLGNLLPFMTELQDQRIKIIWFKENVKIPIEHENISKGLRFALAPDNYISSFGCAVSFKPDAWIWFYSYNFLSEKLQQCLNNKAFKVDNYLESESKNNFLKENYQKMNSEQVLERISHLFLQAIHGYKQIVNSYFTCFKEELRIYSMMPFTIKGNILLNSFNISANSFPIQYYFDILPFSEKSDVNFKLTEEKEIFYNHDVTDQIFLAQRNNLQKLRYDKRFVIQGGTFHIESVNLTNPEQTTQLIYQWLWDDLERISWVHGRYEGNRRTR
ncbi:MAG: hypothetical protein NT007_00045 [Candidatus Kapabacteria bacterium]|nr:hypothetical protein [Candidatus Kapabacteria bacterium]